MQQTQKYGFNLIESSDPFLPAPLNENMQKVETALTKAETARSGAEKKLDQRIAALEAHKIVVGYHAGSSTSYENRVDLGGPPLAVIATGNNSHGLATRGHPAANGLTLTDTGFIHVAGFASCYYIAFF